jgi:hypothetical protein
MTGAWTKQSYAVTKRLQLPIVAKAITAVSDTDDSSTHDLPGWHALGGSCTNSTLLMHAAGSPA